MRNLFNAAAAVSWAISAEWLTTILTIAASEGPGPEAVEAQLGRKLDNTQDVTVRDGVAVVPVVGPVFRYANLFTYVSGATSIQLLARDFTQALNDPAVSAILLDINSPGGEVAGVNEFAAMVYAARGIKPITAYIGGTGASAAYWIASAADEIVADATAIVGSIGVVQALPNPAGRTARDIEIVSSQSPNKRPDVTTERGRAQIQGTIDALGQVFVETVARNRGVSVETVLADFGQGGVLVGQAAVDAGLIDRIGSFESTLAALRPSAPAAPHLRPRGAQESTTMSMTEKPWQEAPVATTPAPIADAAASAELANLRAQVAQMQAQQVEQLKQVRAQAATTFAAEQLRASKITPAEQAPLAALYAACAEQGQAELVTALFEARPASGFTSELVVSNLSVLPLASGDAAQMKAEAEAQASAYAKQVNTKK